MPPFVVHDPVGLGRGFAGGVCIGLVSTSFVYLFGKFLGVSSIVGDLVGSLGYPFRSKMWQLFFVGGMLGGGGILLAVSPKTAVFGQTLGLHWGAALVGGFLVGFGTRLGNGCTSGHGVSGLPRLSPRSLVNVMAFMGSGVLMAGLTRASFSRVSLYGQDWDLRSLFIVPLAASFAAALLLQNLLFALPSRSPIETCESDSQPTLGARPVTLLLVSVHGLAFALALGLSGMCDPSKVLRFLDFAGDGGWDPQLMLVMGGAVMVNGVTYRILAQSMGSREPPFSLVPPGSTFSSIIPYGPKAGNNSKITTDLCLGGIIFGLGWGLCGVCPGPGIVDFVSGGAHFGVAVPSMLAGMSSYHFFKTRRPASSGSDCTPSNVASPEKALLDSSK